MIMGFSGSVNLRFLDFGFSLIAETGKNDVIFTSFNSRVRRLIYVIYLRL